LHPGENFNFILRIQRRNWIKEKEVLAKITYDYKKTKFSNIQEEEQVYYDSAYNFQDKNIRGSTFCIKIKNQ